jgi:hypothetical protein
MCVGEGGDGGKEGCCCCCCDCCCCCCCFGCFLMTRASAGCCCCFPPAFSLPLPLTPCPRTFSPSPDRLNTNSEILLASYAISITIIIMIVIQSLALLSPVAQIASRYNQRRGVSQQRRIVRRIEWGRYGEHLKEVRGGSKRCLWERRRNGKSTLWLGSERRGGGDRTRAEKCEVGPMVAMMMPNKCGDCNDDDDDGGAGGCDDDNDARAIPNTTSHMSVSRLTMCARWPRRATISACGRRT